MNLDGVSVVIIGAGIGGLTAALAFAQKGAVVQVLEQADDITEVGAGIQISPNGGVVLSALGLTQRLDLVSTHAKAAQLRDYCTGRHVLRLPLQSSSELGPYRFVHRADLINLLQSAAVDAGADIKTSCQVSKIDFDDREQASVQFADGTSTTADIVIGADGLHSVVRQTLNGNETPFFTQQVAWRCLVPSTEAVSDVATVYMAPGRHFVTYPLRNSALINIVAVEERNQWTEESWHQSDDPDNLRAAFADFCSTVTNLLDRVETVNRWGLFRHRVAPIWWRGNTAILGDAVHPTLPFMAQGASIAVEDVWALVQCIDSHDNLSEALQSYQNTRADRVSNVVETANRNARIYHLKSPIIRYLTHSALRGVGALAPSLARRKFDWIYKFDATKIPSRQAASSTHKGT